MKLKNETFGTSQSFANFGPVITYLAVSIRNYLFTRRYFITRIKYKMQKSLLTLLIIDVRPVRACLANV